MAAARSGRRFFVISKRVKESAKSVTIPLNQVYIHMPVCFFTSWSLSYFYFMDIAHFLPGPTAHAHKQFYKFLTCLQKHLICSWIFVRSLSVCPTESGEEVTAAASSPKTSRRKEGSGGILDLKGYEEDTIKGGYVLSQDGRKWNRLWYQLKEDFCLYKFRAHEVWLRNVHAVAAFCVSTPWLWFFPRFS